MGATYVRYSMYMTDPPPTPRISPYGGHAVKIFLADSVLFKLSEYIKFFAF